MIRIVGIVLSIFVALEHVLFMVLEMFMWQTPVGRKIFRRSVEDARSSATLAANQGLYNGFLAAGLFFALWSQDRRFALFFLGCVIVAGVYAGVTVSPRIFLVQSVPAIAAAVCVALAVK